MGERPGAFNLGDDERAEAEGSEGLSDRLDISPGFDEGLAHGVDRLLQGELQTAAVRFGEGGDSQVDSRVEGGLQISGWG